MTSKPPTLFGALAIGIGVLVAYKIGSSIGERLPGAAHVTGGRPQRLAFRTERPSSRPLAELIAEFRASAWQAVWDKMAAEAPASPSNYYVVAFGSDGFDVVGENDMQRATGFARQLHEHPSVKYTAIFKLGASAPEFVTDDWTEGGL